mmetsp:Transcript_33244/g.63438  ORF Transcript_33244/g.63438 Transcript_33244/m.63438 type:complete len:226 (+) Transcript_33244:289-966(+)
MTIHHRPSLQHHILILPLPFPHRRSLLPRLLHRLRRHLPLRQPFLVSRNLLPLLFVIVLSFDEPSTFLAFEVVGAAFARAGGHGAVCLGEEAFGFLLGVAEGWEFSSLELSSVVNSLQHGLQFGLPFLPFPIYLPPAIFLPQITLLDRLSGIHSGHGNGSLELDPRVVLVTAADAGIGWCTTVLVGVVGSLVIIVATFGCKPTDLMCIPLNPAISSHLRRGCDGP